MPLSRPSPQEQQREKHMKTGYESWIWNGTGGKLALPSWNVFFLLGWLPQSVKKCVAELNTLKWQKCFDNQRI